jgi:hypothetical protein
MQNTIRVKRVVDGGTQVEKCEIFTFPTEGDRQNFIADLRKISPDAPFATNIDPDETETERYLVAIPTRLYDWVTQGE